MILIKQHRKNRKTVYNIKQSVVGLRRGVRLGLMEIGRENVKHTRKLILDKNKTGRIYLIDGAKHQASAPYEAPANLSGRLQKSINFKVSGSREMEFGDGIFYGKYLERGTKNIRPRPHIGRTVEERSGQNYMALQKQIAREINKRAARGL